MSIFCIGEEYGHKISGIILAFHVRECFRRCGRRRLVSVKIWQMETHTVSIWGPFNIVYGIGLPVFYICSTLLSGWHWTVRFLLLALAGSLVEYLCGLIIRIGIGMRAWDYREHSFNIQGLISPFMALVWGILGLGFDLFLYAPLKRVSAYIDDSRWNMLCIGLSIFMIINFSLTAVCIIRWANRHKGKPFFTVA